MEGRGRALDTVLVARWWRTVQDAEVSVTEYETPREAIRGLEQYVAFDHGPRLHQALDYRTPAAGDFASSL